MEIATKLNCLSGDWKNCAKPLALEKREREKAGACVSFSHVEQGLV